MLTYNAPVPVVGELPSANSLSSTADPLVRHAQSVDSMADAGWSGVHHIWLVTGPAGCGKTTVAQHLSKALNIPYIEGDAVGLVQSISKAAAENADLTILIVSSASQHRQDGQRDSADRR